MLIVKLFRYWQSQLSKNYCLATPTGVSDWSVICNFLRHLGIPIAILADRYSRRNIIAISVIIWSGMTALCGLAGSYVQLALARIGVGIGEAGSSPPSHSMISDLYLPEKRATAMGIYAAGINVGVLLGFLVGGWVDEWYGWRMAFFVVGLPGILLGLLMFFTVQEPTRTQGPNQCRKTFSPRFGKHLKS